jgi:hypothetical protein
MGDSMPVFSSTKEMGSRNKRGKKQEEEEEKERKESNRTIH